MPRINYLKPEIHKPSTKEIFYSLQTEYQWVEILDNKPYSALFNIIKKEATKNDDDCSPTPTIKQIAESINQKPAVVTKWLNQIYSDIWELNQLKPHLFKSEGNKYLLHFQDSSTKQTVYFTLWTTANFTQNDSFDWSFVNGVLGWDYFYISEISHSRNNGEFTTTIYLKTGLGNAYREFLLNKAKFLNLIDYSEIYNLSGFELDEILRSKIENDRPYFPPGNGRKRFSRRFN